MRVSYSYILTAATMVLLPLGVLRAADPPVAPPDPALVPAPTLAMASSVAPVPPPSAAPAPVPGAAPAPAASAAPAAAMAPGAAQDGCNPCWDPIREFQARVGYWANQNSGSQVKTGEYQDTNSSAFYDFDAFFSDGCRTLNATVTGTDQETNAVSLNYYGPSVEANFEYQRFIHNLGHEDLGQFVDSGGTAYNTGGGTAVGSPGNIVRAQSLLRQDVDPGEDYAIRVQEFKSNFKTQLTPDLKIRLDVWGIYKEGERQVNSMLECYPHSFSTTTPPPGSIPNQVPSNNHCHILSQAQHIDWQTTEVKPVVEWNMGPLVIEYSRPMRTFTANDQTDYRYYDYDGMNPGSTPYALVPDNTTQIDQLKISGDVNNTNRFYTFMYVGETHSTGEGVLPNGTLAAQDNDRFMRGVDLRWTNTTIDNVTITPYVRYLTETNTFSNPAVDTTFPIDYDRSQEGVRTLWRPFGGGFGLGGLAISSEFEHGELHRSNLDFPQDGIGPSSLTGAQLAAGVIDEDHTITNTFSIGPTVRWSTELNTYLKYKYYDTEDALFAVAYHNPSSRDSPAYSYAALATNSALPQFDNIVEFGGTWLPSAGFMLNGWMGIDLQSQSEGELVVNNTYTNVHTPSTSRTVPLSFTSENYPCGINGSYQAGDKWTINGGAAYYTNWIDQDQTFSPGSDHGFGGTVTPAFPAGPSGNQYGALVNRIAYGGRAAVLNVGASYWLTPKMRLQGQAEYVHGIESAYQLSGDPLFPQTNAALASIPGLYGDSVVIVRVSAGVDYRISPRVTTYFRYIYMDYQDSADKELAAGTLPIDGLPLSGTTNMFLTGLNATF